MNFKRVKTVIFHISIIVLFLIFSLQYAYSWDLTSLGLENSNYKIRHISRSYVRTFLSIESTNNSLKIPTLIETTWPENILKVCPKIYPNYVDHGILNEQDCSKIQQSGWTEIDDIGRLWLLDLGNKYCNVKLNLYEIWSDKNTNEYKQIHWEICPFRQDTINSMKLINLNGINGQNIVILFTFNHGKYIWMYYYSSRTWRKLKFHDTNMNRININQITLSSNRNIELKLFLANKSGQLYSTNLPFCLNQTDIRINNIGSLLGLTNWMITDPNNLLYYILPKDGAVVRCDPTKSEGLSAENHEILMLQTIPIVQIFFGVKGSVWAAMETMINNGGGNDHCQRMLYHYSLKSDFSHFIDNRNDCES